MKYYQRTHRFSLTPVHRTKSVHQPSVPAPLVKEVQQWSTEDVGNWIMTLNLNAGDIPHYVEAFLSRNITGKDLLRLEKRQLRSILGSSPDTIVAFFVQKLRSLRLVHNIHHSKPTTALDCK